jgi:hypothetical protein
MGLLQSTFRPTQVGVAAVAGAPPEELTAANLVLTTIESVGIFVGPRDRRPSADSRRHGQRFSRSLQPASCAAALLTRRHLGRAQSGCQVRKKSFVSEAFAGFGTVAHDARLRLIISLYGMQTLLPGRSTS